MSYESSYETGGRPFRPNKDRGLWSSSSDFVFTCMCNAFRMDLIYGISLVPLLAEGGIIMILTTLLNFAIYAVPIIFIQSFLGQFSSSGFISALRIAPLFKGLGYIAVFLNLSSLAFYTVFAAVPLMFFVYSLQPTLPWSCEGIKDWLHDTEERNHTTHCTINHTEINLQESFAFLTLPSLEFFAQEVQKSFSFPLFACVILVWAGVAYVLCNTTEMIGKFIRYSTMVLIALLTIVFIRMAFLPGSIEGLGNFFGKGHWSSHHFFMCIVLPPLTTFSIFGPGWGSILTMASYNKFKTDIYKFSWIISFAQLGFLAMTGIMCGFAESHLTQNSENVMAPIFEQQWSSFLTIPSSLASMEWPHLWTWMFLVVLVLGSFNLIIVQIFSVLTAVLDEFEQLRAFRKEIIYGGIGVLTLVSALFCTEDGVLSIEVLTDLNVVTQGLLNLILLIVVLWVYGRERFQRDVEFMTSQILQTWKIFVVRIVTPGCLFLTLALAILLSLFNHRDASHLVPIGWVVTIVPWLALPAYCIYRLMETKGDLRQRFKLCTRPADWYPVDPQERERYEETIDNPEPSQPLTTIVL